MRARIAWGVVAVTTLAVILDTVFTAAHRPLMSESAWAEHGWPLAPLASAGCALMGALIVSRYPRHPLGWLLCAASLLSVTLAAEAYSIWVLDGDGPGSDLGAHVAAWAGPLLGWPAFTALIMVFLLSPDGHLPSPRWRWAVWVTAAGLLLYTVGWLTLDPSAHVYGEQYDGRPLTTALLTVGYLLVATGLLASAASLALRLRRARDDERRQLLWIASSAAFLAFGVVVILAVPRLPGGEEGTWLAALPLHLAQLAVPLCVAVAVLRHRLLEIDLIVNRALVLGMATGLVALGYVLVVVAIGEAIGEGTGGLWPSLFATALVALAFQPLRNRVVRVADRLAFGPAAAPYEALAAFSRRIGETPDPTGLLPTVAEAAAHAVNASSATVRLQVAAGADRVAVWPPPTPDDPAANGVEIPVVHGGERLGSVTVAMPAGHPLRAREFRLLTDLADQAGMAFRNARLTAELSGQVEQLGEHTRHLADSRRRLISAGDAERSRLERSIGRQVIPHLEPLPTRLRDMSRINPYDTGALDPGRLGPMVDSLNTALEALREITRGVFPAQLARSGLPAALRSHLARTGSRGRLVIEGSVDGRRFDPRVEAAAYFCVAETTRDLGDPVLVMLGAEGGELRVHVSGTDRGDLSVSHVRDRVEAAGGTVSLTTEDECTTIEVRLAALAPGQPTGPDSAAETPETQPIAVDQNVTS